MRRLALVALIGCPMIAPSPSTTPSTTSADTGSDGPSDSTDTSPPKATADTGGTGDTGVIDDCHATFEAPGRDVVILTDALATGTEEAPFQLTLTEPGILTLCEGITYASVHSTAASLTVRGKGADQTTLSGGGVDSVIIVSEGSGAVLVEDITLADGRHCGGALLGIQDKVDPENCGPFTVYPFSTVTLRRVVATGATSRLDDGSAIKIGNSTTLTLEDSVVEGSSAVGIEGSSSTVVCTNSAIRKHASNGIWFFASGFAQASGTSCDFGTDNDANGASDVVFFSPGDPTLSEDYEGVVDFSCTSLTGC